MFAFYIKYFVNYKQKNAAFETYAASDKNHRLNFIHDSFNKLPFSRQFYCQIKKLFSYSPKCETPIVHSRNIERP